MQEVLLYQLHFTNEETEAQWGIISKFTHLEGARTGIKTQTAQLYLFPFYLGIEVDSAGPWN